MCGSPSSSLLQLIAKLRDCWSYLNGLLILGFPVAPNQISYDILSRSHLIYSNISLLLAILFPNFPSQLSRTLCNRFSTTPSVRRYWRDSDLKVLMRTHRYLHLMYEKVVNYRCWSHSKSVAPHQNPSLFARGPLPGRLLPALNTKTAHTKNLPPPTFLTLGGRTPFCIRSTNPTPRPGNKDSNHTKKPSPPLESSLLPCFLRTVLNTTRTRCNGSPTQN